MDLALCLMPGLGSIKNLIFPVKSSFYTFEAKLYLNDKRDALVEKSSKNMGSRVGWSQAGQET